jgi:hypothetical protein
MSRRPQELGQHLARRLAYAPPRCVSNTLAAMAALRHPAEPALLLAASAHVADPASRWGASDARAPAAATVANVLSSSSSSSGRYSLRELASVCRSLAALGFKPPAGWADAVTDAAARWLEEAGEASGEAAAPPARRVGGLFFGALGGAPDRGGQLRDAASARARQGGEALRAVALLHALARLRVPPGAAAWRAFLAALSPLLPALPPSGLTLLLSSAAALRLRLPAEQQGPLLLASHRRLTGMRHRDLAACLHAFVRLGVDPGPRYAGVTAWRSSHDELWQSMFPS